MRRFRHIRMLHVAAACLVGLVFWSAGALMVDRFGQTQQGAPRADAIVVLGARVLEGGVPSGALRARVERAVELFHEGAAPLLVFSGGVGDHPPSEAQVMLRLAAEQGVPESACLLEEDSHSTFDNARFTARLLKARGLRRVLLVTDPYHLFRARQHFWREGVDAHPVAALMVDRNLTLKDRAYWSLREVLALVRRPHLLFARRPSSEG